MERQTTKIGARVLSAAEMNMILPGADSVFEQIEVFRRDTGDSAGRQEFEQKTNNIGIIGRRGAGKTSVLKTFRQILLDKNEGREKNKDIVLPLIVPENMYSGTALMDVVLGMLKTEVEKEKRAHRQSCGDCIYSGRNSLEKGYNELVKQYCYIKKDYRDILIRQFTTEQNYVDKTKEVFNSDTEFITLFREFIDRLMKERRGSTGENNDALLFLFIDDMDLSTTRCTDVVRKLLSYLSHPRIVTFISGDMQTFEEALTLDFLRQENALHKKLFEETYFSVEGEEQNCSLLERKKEMAYEYLKKIIPPAYRKRIKHWSLEERGYYQVAGKDGKKQSSLMELLIRATERRTEKGYFAYEEGGSLCPLGPVYHMFDSTSRGLNNVYNVLQELCGQCQDEDIGFWRLIETIVDSKPLYSGHKEDLLQRILVHGQGQVKIDFENAGRFLYPEHKHSGNTEKGNKITIEEEQREETGNNGRTDRFAIFTLIDFAAHLFKLEQWLPEEYFELKNRVIGEYLCDDAIDGQTAGYREPLNLQYPIRWGVEKSRKMGNAGTVLYHLLQQGDFIFDLYLVKYLGKDETNRILGGEPRKTHSEQANMYRVAYGFAKMLETMCEKGEKLTVLAHLKRLLEQDMFALLSGISLNPGVVYGERLVPESFLPDKKYTYHLGNPSRVFYGVLAHRSFDNVESFLTDARAFENARMWLWAKYENHALPYWIYYDKYINVKSGGVGGDNEEIRKLLHTGIKRTIMAQLEPVMQQYEAKPLQAADDFVTVPGNDRQAERRSKQHKAILLIDEQNLWKDDYVREHVGKYLENEVADFVEKLVNNRPIFDATSLLRHSYIRLENCCKDAVDTDPVIGLCKRIREFLIFVPGYSEAAGAGEPSGMDGKGTCYMTLDQVQIFQRMIEELLGDVFDPIRCGRKEAMQLWMELREMPLIFPDEGWTDISGRIQAWEDAVLSKLEEKIKENPLLRALGEEGLQGIVKSFYDRYYGSEREEKADAGEVTLSEVVERELTAGKHKPDQESICYIMYLVQKRQIEAMKSEFAPEGSAEPSWEQIETIVPKQDCKFLFHSYLRYLQANEIDAAKAGLEAGTVASFARDLLDSEALAAAGPAGNAYERIGRKLELTEEEFGALFEGRRERL